MRTQFCLTILLSLLLTSCSKFQTKEETKKALIVVTNHSEKGNTGKKTGWFLSEVTHIYYPLIKAGFEVDFASPKGGYAPLDKGSILLNDELNKKFYESKTLMNRMNTTIALKDIDSSRYEIIHFAGGHGAMWDFPNSKALNKVTAHIYERGGLVSAVCHGPAALVNVKLSNGTYLVKDKEVSAFTNREEKAVGLEKVVPFMLETKLKKRGAKTVTAKNWSDQVSVDGRLITGQNPQSAKTLGHKLVELYQKGLTMK